MSEPAALGDILVRGQARYEIFCSHCHDLVGNGRGMVPQRGFPEPPTFHSERLRAAPLGHVYQVITSGKDDMPAHRDQIPARDRWAIAAYVRALQFSQHADISELPPTDVERLEAVQP
jgi:mono/diheme cytochrome c family protein